MPEGIQISSTDAPEVIQEQLTLEDGQRSEETQIEQERSENGNGQTLTKRGVDKRIDRLVKERSQARAEAAELKQRLAQYETNGNGAAPHVEEQGQESRPEERQQEQERETPAEEPKIRALRERYPDWDDVMTRAKNEGMSISDDAAQVMHASANAGHIAYMLASNDQFRAEFNKLTPKQQVKEMRRIDVGVAEFESGAKPLTDRIKATLSKEELAGAVQAIKDGNPLAANIVFSLAKKINLLPNAPEVFKALAGDRETCERLAQMNQERAEMEITRLSGRLEGNGKYVAPVSKAPPPIRPLGGGALRPTVDPADPELPYQEYKKLRERQEREDREARYGRR